MRLESVEDRLRAFANRLQAAASKYPPKLAMRKTNAFGVVPPLRRICVSAFHAALLLLASSTICRAGLITFDGLSLADEALLTTEIPGLTFHGAVLAFPGGPRTAFGGPDFGPDTLAPGQPVDGAFITDLLTDPRSDVPSIITVDFASPVKNVSFYILDIDTQETVTGRVFDASDHLLESITITKDDPGTGDAIATLMSFQASGVSRLVIDPTASDFMGWGVDNLSFTPVPEPPTFALFGIASLLIFGRRRRDGRDARAVRL